MEVEKLLRQAPQSPCLARCEGPQEMATVLRKGSGGRRKSSPKVPIAKFPNALLHFVQTLRLTCRILQVFGIFFTCMSDASNLSALSTFLAITLIDHFFLLRRGGCLRHEIRWLLFQIFFLLCEFLHVVHHCLHLLLHPLHLSFHRRMDISVNPQEFTFASGYHEVP